MSIYDEGRIARKVVYKAEGGINIRCACGIKYYSLREILDMQPHIDHLTIKVFIDSEFFILSYYPHLIYRVIKVHGKKINTNSSYETRLAVLKSIIAKKLTH